MFGGYLSETCSFFGGAWNGGGDDLGEMEGRERDWEEGQEGKLWPGYNIGEKSTHLKKH